MLRVDQIAFDAKQSIQNTKKEFQVIIIVMKIAAVAVFTIRKLC